MKMKFANPFYLNILFFSLFFQVNIAFTQVPADFFVWENATVYFLLTDRFNDGNNANNTNYSRVADPVGGFLGGDFQGITDKINEGYFDDLGVNAIWFTSPVEQMHGYVPGYWCPEGYPCASTGDKHYGYHGYYALDWTEPDANYGNITEFEAFVDAAHARGIRVVMDVVLNHTGYDNEQDAIDFNLGPISDPDDSDWCNWWNDGTTSWIRKGDTATDYCAPACAGGGTLNGCLAGLPDIRTDLTTDVSLPNILKTKWDATKETQETSELTTFWSNNPTYDETPANYIIKWLTDWVREYGIDGFRIDTYKHVELEVWGRLKDQAQIALNDWRAANPGDPWAGNTDPFWMVAEDFGAGPGIDPNAISIAKTDAKINFNFKDQAGNPSSLDATYANYASIAADPDWNFLSYISSHDDGMFDRNDLIDAGTSLLMSPGAVQIYYGDETARPLGTSGSDQDTRSFMNWGGINTAVKDHWEKLGTFRKAHPAIGAGTHTKIADAPYTFKREYSDATACDAVVVVIGASGSTTIDVSSVYPDGTAVRDAYTGNTSSVAGGAVTFNADANGVILIERTGAVTCPPTVHFEAQAPLAATDWYDPNSIDVNINASIPGGGTLNIYYTTDGSTPTAASTPYTSTLTFGNPTDLELKAIACESGTTNCSAVASQRYLVGPITDFKVYFEKPTSWTDITPKIHHWDALPNGNLADTAWPGNDMTHECDNWYSYTFSNILSSKVIFNNGSGNGSNQTNELYVDQVSYYDDPVDQGASYTMKNGIPNLGCDTPTACFSATPSSGASPLNVAFDGTCSTTPASTTITTYAWDFGDGSLAGSGASPSHTYAADGFYTAVLTVTNSLGETDIATTNITVGTTPDITVYFEKPIGWGATIPKIHYWNANPTGVLANTTWPGVDMMLECDNWYSYTFSNITNVNIIFHDNAGSQTNDLFADQTSFYNDPVVQSGSFSMKDGAPNLNTCGLDACFSATPSAGTSPLAVNFDATCSTVASGSSITSYVWDFGDGSLTGSGAMPAHTYTMNGSFTVTLTVTNDLGGTDTETMTIAVGEDLTVYFKRPSGWTETPHVHYWDDMPDNLPNSIWPGIEMIPLCDDWYSHTFSNITSLNVIFNNDNNGIQTPNIIGVSETSYYDDASMSTSTMTGTGEPSCPPIANFTATPNTGTSPLNFSFDATSSTSPAGTSITNYAWDYGDGNSGTGSTTSHNYISDGFYVVTLTVTNDTGGTDTETTTITVGTLPSITVYFKTPDAWTGVTPNVHHFDAMGGTLANSTYPGIPMTPLCDNWYAYTFPSGISSTSVIFNNGSTGVGTNQTPDIVGISQTAYYDGNASMGASTMTGLGTPTCPAEACFTASTTAGVAPLTVNFDASCSTTPAGTSISSYSWDFGDTSPTGSGSSVTHNFIADGAYTVTLTITNNQGETATATTTINVGSQDGLTVYFKNTNSWSNVYIHYWNTVANIGASTWPGVAMTLCGNDWWEYTFPDGTTSANMLFNDGAGNQTADLTRSSDGWYDGSTWSATGSCSPNTSGCPSLTDTYIITFDATGTALEAATKVYLHSGLSTTAANPTAFNRTVGNWGADDGVGEMMNTGGNMWSFTITPDLKTFYGVDDTEDIFGINYLFRSADGTLKEDNGGNNYWDCVTTGDYFTITSPANAPFLAEVGTAFDLTSTANVTPDSWTVEEVDAMDNVITTVGTGSGFNPFTQSITLTNTTLKRYKITANFGGTLKHKFFEASGYDPVCTDSRPAGVLPGINYNPSDPTKATLVLHAPTYTRFYSGTGALTGTNNTTPKNVVHVVGDFNNWTISESYKLCRDSDGWNGVTDADNDGDRGDYWWIELTGLTPGQQHVFQYVVDGNLFIADPYAAQISDPDDNFIGATVYPNLVAYPSTQTNGRRASVLQTNQTDYVFTAPDFTRPTTNDLNIYELHFRDFTDEGTYLAAIERLDYIKDLGINAIHVMPISEFEGNSSWGYNPNFYFAADKAYGTPDDLKKFIDECHKRKIQVFNDLVLNHAFESNVMARMYWNADGPCDPDKPNGCPSSESPYFNQFHKMVRNTAGHWGVDWNHESEHVQNFVDRALDYWLQEFKFDGFRFDFTKGLGQTDPNDFPFGDDWASNFNQSRIDLLKRIVDGMWARNPGAVAIFEHLANSDEDKELADHGILMWSGVGHHNAMKNFMLGYDADNPDIYSSGIYNATGRDFNLANWMSYMESHDEERQAYEVMQFGKDINGSVEKMVDRLKLGASYNLLFPGPRMIWQFEELAYDVSINFNGRTGEKPVRWEYCDDPHRKELYRQFSTLLYLRNHYDLFANTPDYDNIGWGANAITTPRRMVLNDGAGHYVIVIGNLDPDAAHDAFPNYPVTGTWYRYNGDPTVDHTTFMVNASGDAYNLAASEVLVLTNFRIDNPVLDQRIKVSIKAFLGGAYNSGTDLMTDNLRSLDLIPTAEPYTTGNGETTTSEVFDITGNDAPVDWVLVELRDKNDNSSVLAQRAALLQRDGDVVDVDGACTLTFTGVSADDYYVAIKHRNHLGTMTNATVSLSDKPVTAVVDFTDVGTMTYGTNGQQNNGGVMMMWGGSDSATKQISYDGGINPMRTALLNQISSHGGNFFGFPTYVFNSYSDFDYDLDGQVSYDGGVNPGRTWLLNLITNHPNNFFGFPTFIFNQQIP